jgi:hypothetical protein
VLSNHYDRTMDVTLHVTFNMNLALQIRFPRITRSRAMTERAPDSSDRAATPTCGELCNESAGSLSGFDGALMADPYFPDFLVVKLDSMQGTSPRRREAASRGTLAAHKCGHPLLKLLPLSQLWLVSSTDEEPSHRWQCGTRAWPGRPLIANMGDVAFLLTLLPTHIRRCAG